jgi:putative peptidoglycan lipid II flippase
MAIAGWTIVSRVSGFARVAAIAAVLGPTFFGNLFETVNLLPNLTHQFLTGALITALLVPPLVRSVDLGRIEDQRRMARGFLGVLMVIFAAAIVLVVLLGPLVMQLLTAAVRDGDVRDAQVRVGWPLLAMLTPQALLYGIADVGVAVQNSRGKFALAAAAPVAENLGIIAVMALSAAIFGLGVGVEEVSSQQLLLLGLGTTAAVGLHAAIQWWGAWRLGVPLYPRAGWRDPEVRKIVRLAVPSAGFAGLAAARHLGLLVAAGSIPGGAIALQIGQYFLNFPVAVGARPVVVAQLPRLSRVSNRGELTEFHLLYQRGLALIMFVAVPASILLMALARPFARSVAFGEMASDVGVTLVAVSIAAVAAGILGESVFVASTSASYARQKVRPPLMAMLLRVGLSALGVAAAMAFTEDVGLLVALGVTISISNIASAVALHRSVVSVLPPIPPQPRGQRMMDVVVSIVAVATAALAVWLLPEVGGPIDRFAGVVVGGLLAMGIYLLLQRARGSRELTEFAGSLRGESRAAA